MDRTIRQQEQKLMQLQSKVAHLTCLVEPRAARENAKRLAMMMWMQGREERWDAR
jgi:hypothetical protein